MGNRSKIHTIYKLEDGTRVPGVTTILGVYNSDSEKERLMHWSWKLGTQGLDYRKETKADIGKLAHYLLMCYFKGRDPAEEVLAEYSPIERDKADNALLSYYHWEKGKKLQPILVEQPLVSEKYRVGATPDLFCALDDVLTLLDWKSGGGIYLKHKCQVVTYGEILSEKGYTPEDIAIVRIPITEDESFEYKKLTKKEREICLRIFERAVGIYYDQKELLGWQNDAQ